MLLKTRGCSVLSLRPAHRLVMAGQYILELLSPVYTNVTVTTVSWEGQKNLWKCSVEQPHLCEYIPMAKGAPAAFHRGLSYF